MNSYWDIVPMRRKANFLFIQFRRQTLIDWSMSLSDENKMKRNCFDNSHELSPFFFLLTEINKKTWSLIVKCRSSCSWDQIKTVCFFSGIFNVFPVLHSNTGCLLKIFYWKSIMASYWVKKQLDTKTNMNTVQFRN